MLLTADIEEKTIGSKVLFRDLHLTVAAGEKVALIGRNGAGKTTLFRMLTGSDTDFTGSITIPSGVRIVATQQEHHEVGERPVIAYALDNLPDYRRLEHIIETYPDHMEENLHKIKVYSDALEDFLRLDYYTVEDRIRETLGRYQLDADARMAQLSGGQKRLVELAYVEHTMADVTLLDEPTNHMDYVAKDAFVQWFRDAKQALMIITHDRALLQEASRIIEIKDGKAVSLPGNYDSYLKQNTERTSNELNEYEVTQRRILNIKKQIQYARSKKSGWSGTADKKNPFVVMETRLLKELHELETHERPMFWIDQESTDMLQPKIAASYERHKAKTIRLPRQTKAQRRNELLRLEEASIGYDTPLFSPLNHICYTGDRIHLIGRNGAGKTTLVHAISAAAAGDVPATLLGGSIKASSTLRLNTYEQEMPAHFLSLRLADCVQRIYDLYNIPLSIEQTLRILASYLFDPQVDRDQPVSSLSGGQKARLQLIKLFANDPNFIILDEPTNHLDLPSIEELEAALTAYHGTVLYISHDAYLAKHLGGDSIVLTQPA